MISSHMRASRKRTTRGHVAAPLGRKKRKAGGSPACSKVCSTAGAGAGTTAAAAAANHKVAMSLYRKYQPGLGHDGDGLYGALTNNSLAALFAALPCAGRRVCDIGAADGKVLLAALAHGARAAHGVEVAGDALVGKFDSMVAKLRQEGVVGAGQTAGLKCNVNVARLPTAQEGSVEAMLAGCFPEEFSDLVATKPGRASCPRDLLITAVWHGFNVEAKQALLKLLAQSQCVERFVVVGPQSFPYGRADEILAFLKDDAGCTWKPQVTSNIVVKLSGGGETYHAITVSSEMKKESK
jgi:hypothetical protein